MIDQADNNQTENLPVEERNKRQYKVAIIAPTCFYYQVDLFRQLSADPRLDLVVYFCSDEALNSKDAEKMYNTNRKWGISSKLLDGFRSKFLKNYSPTPSY